MEVGGLLSEYEKNEIEQKVECECKDESTNQILLVRRRRMLILVCIEWKVMNLKVIMSWNMVWS